MIETIIHRQEGDIYSSEDEPPLGRMRMNASKLIGQNNNFEWQRPSLCGSTILKIAFKVALDYQKRIQKVDHNIYIPSVYEIAASVMSGPEISHSHYETYIKPFLWSEDEKEFYKEEGNGRRSLCLPDNILQYIDDPNSVEVMHNVTINELQYIVKSNRPLLICGLIQDPPQRHDKEVPEDLTDGHWLFFTKVREKRKAREGEIIDYIVDVIDLSTAERAFENDLVITDRKRLNRNTQFSTRNRYGISYNEYLKDNFRDKVPELNLDFQGTIIVFNLETLRPPKRQHSVISQPSVTL